MLKEEEDRKKAKEAEDKALRKLKERQDFEERIGAIVGTKINDACEIFLGKTDKDRISPTDPARARGVQLRGRATVDVEKEQLEKQIEVVRREHECIKKHMEELTRTLKQTSAGTKRAGSGVCITSPPEAPARGKARVLGTGTTTSSEFQKLLRAYNLMKEEKRMADIEVQALRDRFEKAMAKLRGDDQGQTEEGLDDLTLRPSPPKRTSDRLASKAAITERNEFIKETKKYLKRLKKHGLQILCGKEGISFVTCEQAINELAELRASLPFDFRPVARDNCKSTRAQQDSAAEEIRDDTEVGTDVQETQHIDADDDEQLGEE
ncbi:hypothetical protein CBR_g52115 [Chara braunii]|uniref:Uncharacterized protein n=1 Tax=Chara braunii TaxID=69332 RepID=A0A388M9S2_CHABU|nr:hypothetical protein CBR_g52115 [Chara braunii]|eukprot:GBG91233.1 hypothetical protein CBR_g52115 [Chara braunii]